MKMTDTMRGVGTTARVAATAAPYARRAITDEELHDALRGVAGTTSDLVGRLSSEGLREALTDREVRDDIGAIADSVQRAAQRVVERPRRSFARTLFMVTGFVTVAGAGVLTAALVYPPTRSRLGRFFQWSSRCLSDTADDVRTSAADFANAAGQSVSDAGSDLREQAGEAADELREKVGGDEKPAPAA